MDDKTAHNIIRIMQQNAVDEVTSLAKRIDQLKADDPEELDTMRLIALRTARMENLQQEAEALTIALSKF